MRPQGKSTYEFVFNENNQEFVIAASSARAVKRRSSTLSPE